MRIKAKSILFFVVVAMFQIFGFAHAKDFGYSIEAIDENEKPVSDVEVQIYLQTMSSIRDAVYLKTNDQGIVSGVVSSVFPPTVWLVKDGYYSSKGVMSFMEESSVLRMTMKRKISPISLYVRTVNLTIPALGMEFGFDFEIGDWVAPNGTGIKQDVTFEMTRVFGAEDEFEQTLRMVFPKHGDGVHIVPLTDSVSESEFPYLHNAPLDGYVDSEHFLLRHGKIDQIDFGDSEFRVLRIRSVIENETVVSANYAKIFPEIQLTKGFRPKPGFRMTYYFNPIENSRNLEFDPSKNLYSIANPEDAIRFPP